MIINKELFIVAKTSVDYNILLEEKLKYSEQENAKMRELIREAIVQLDHMLKYFPVIPMSIKTRLHEWLEKAKELIGGEQ